MTVLPAKLSRVMPVNVDMAPQLGEERNCWMVSSGGRVSDTWIRKEGDSSIAIGVIGCRGS